MGFLSTIRTKAQAEEEFDKLEIYLKEQQAYMELKFKDITHQINLLRSGCLRRFSSKTDEVVNKGKA